MPHKSSNSKSFGEVVSHWGLLFAGLTANAKDLAHLDSHRLELESVLTQAQGILAEQKIQTSAKQDLTRQVEVLLDKGRKLAAFLRVGVKQHYGHRSEKMVEFDLLPFRGKAKAKPAVTAVQAPTPATPVTPKPKVDPTHPAPEPTK